MRTGRPPEPLEARFWRYVRKAGPDECWLWIGCLDAYGYEAMNSGKHACSLKAHRVSYELHKGPVPKGLEVCHSCKKRACVNPAHLRADTRRSNQADRIKDGTANIGTQNPMAVVTEGIVRKIRMMYIPRRCTLREVGKVFGIGESTVRDIVRRKTWGHVL